MKTILSALVALSVLAAAAAPVSAAEFDTQKFWQEQHHY
jgi:Ni/Co efflux regulator RcnB